MDYTKEQDLAIHLRDENIMVSAGAGAGKTRVLVDRVAMRILDPDDPVSAEEFLVMTFTEAAASEMKERIEKTLKERLDENPGDLWLHRQIRRVRQADISTIHSFCSRLIRARYNELGLDPSFRIGEEGELELIRKEAIEDLLEESYQEGREEFLRFSEAFAPNKDDSHLEDMIQRLYTFSRSFPDGEGWLRKRLDDTKEEGLDQALDNYLKEALDYLGLERHDLEGILDYGVKNGFGDSRSQALAHKLMAIIDRLMEEDTFDGFGQALVTQIRTYPDKKGMGKTDKQRHDFQDLYNLHERLKKMLKNWNETTFSMTRDQILVENKALVPFVDELIRLVLGYGEAYARKKGDKNVYDFDDLEHFALDLLVEDYDEDGQPIPTEAGREISEKYREIYVDEYQDVNLIQETLIKVLYNPGYNYVFTVGDVKQSIYGFRQSRPDMFLARSRAYQKGQGVEIGLLENFRSQPAVINCVNYFFRKLMEEDFGGVDYDDHNALKCGLVAEEKELQETVNKDQSELLLFIDDDEYQKAKAKVDALLTETAMIGARIEELIKEGYNYGDMVILLRSAKNRAEDMADYLERCGIPTLCQTQTGYFETREIRVIMNYLAVIDNVYQDIPMASVMLSSIGGFTENDLVRLRIQWEPEERDRHSLYDWMCRYSEREEEDDLSGKVKGFLDLLHEFRSKKKETPLPDLLWEIYRKTGFFYDVQLMKEGETRKQNLLMLLKKAEEYEQTAYKGLFYFNRYMDQLRSYEVSMGKAFAGSASPDRVSIMTIHKSKGLEFPVVFVSRLSGKLNLRDTYNELVFHPELGIGLEYKDIKYRIRHKTFAQKIIQDRLKKESLEEELRVLYVAMTRAEKKLILTGIVTEKALAELDTRSLTLAGKLSATTAMNWILPAMKGNSSMEDLLGSRKDNTGREEDGTLDETTESEDRYREEADSIQVIPYHWGQLKDWFAEEDQSQDIPDLDEFLNSLKENKDVEAVEKAFSYAYPYREETGWKRKYSVSELKRAAYTPVPGEGQEERLYPSDVPVTVPAFLDKENKAGSLAPTMYGTLVHKVMELLPFGQVDQGNMTPDQIKDIQEAYPLTKKLNWEPLLTKIKAFLTCEEGLVLAQADREGRVYKETPFTIGIPASEVYPDTESQEFVIIQGVIDLYCETGDGLWLIDYKTDGVKEGEESLLLDRYKAQMIYYKTALEQVTGKKVVKMDLYSFRLDKFIPVDF